MEKIKIRPSKRQLDFLDWEFGVFFHFGIRTFNKVRDDFDYTAMQINNYNPENIDCDSWIKTIKEAGAKYAVFTAKHHDGFSNWPSAYTDYSVANVPWKNGKGDVVRDYVNACRKYGVKVGIYYSPADISFINGSQTHIDYDEYFINQISELLTNYGQIDYLWFDGCGSENHTYDTVRIISVIRTLQPNILIFSMWDPDVRWIGNEAGLAPMPSLNTVDSLDFSIKTTEKEVFNNNKFLPGECDFRMRYYSWFTMEGMNDEDTVKSVDELMGIYYYSVGRGTNFIINIGPDSTGNLPPKDAQALIDFGIEIKRRFSYPVVGFSNFTQEGNKFICKSENTSLVNHIVLAENTVDGESILGFKIYIKPTFYGEEILVYNGCNIGHKAICQFPTVKTNEIIVEITDYISDYKLDDIKVFYINR